MIARHEAIIKQLHSFTESVINERRKKISSNTAAAAADQDKEVDEFGNKKKMAFLDLLLLSRVDGKPLDDEGIREEVDTFMFEGHDTTTSGIAFVFLSLAKNPKIQQQVYEECVQVFGDKSSATMQDLNQLSFMEKVIKESFRMYPPVKN